MHVPDTVTLFPQNTVITRFATRFKAEDILYHSAVIMVSEIGETISFADRNGIAYVSNWKGCVTVIPVIRRNKIRYRVSLTQWRAELPF